MGQIEEGGKRDRQTEKERDIERERERDRQREVTYCIIENSQEVDLICQTVCLGLQFNLIHVGSIYILTGVNNMELGYFSCTAMSALSPWQTCSVINRTCKAIPLHQQRIPSAEKQSAHLLQGHKFILCCCALVDFIFISTRGRVPHIVVSR